MEKFLGASFHIELANPKIWKRNSHDLTNGSDVANAKRVKPVGNLAMVDAPSRSIHLKEPLGWEIVLTGQISNLETSLRGKQLG